MAPKINWNPSRKDLRNFGLTVLIGFALIGLLVYRRGKVDAAASIWAISSAVAFLAIVLPSLARPFYWVWVAVAFLLGSVMSRVIMTIIFFGVLTPVALLFRLIKRDALNRRSPARAQSSYWVEHPKIEDLKYYEHMF